MLASFILSMCSERCHSARLCEASMIQYKMMGYNNNNEQTKIEAGKTRIISFDISSHALLNVKNDGNFILCFDLDLFVSIIPAIFFMLISRETLENDYRQLYNSTANYCDSSIFLPKSLYQYRKICVNLDI